MATSFYSDHGKLEGSTVTMNDDFDVTDLPPEKAGTALDRRDMARMGKVQEMRRNFSFIPIFGFAAVLMITWEAVFNSASYVIINGGLAGMVWMYIVTFFGFGAAILAMAEMASMAPTSGGVFLGFLRWSDVFANVASGQYHWVSEFAPKSYQKIMSYIVGEFLPTLQPHQNTIIDASIIRLVLRSRLASWYRGTVHDCRFSDHRDDRAQQRTVHGK